MAWSKRVFKNKVVCLSCGRGIGLKPINCVEQKHSSYYQKRKDNHNRYRRKKREKNPYIWSSLEEHNRRSRESYRKKKRDIIRGLGGKCCRCGFGDFRALTIDHKNEGGNEERKLYGWNYLKILCKLSPTKLKAGYQCLCANCNTIKEFERKWKK